MKAKVTRLIASMLLLAVAFSALLTSSASARTTYKVYNWGISNHTLQIFEDKYGKGRSEILNPGQLSRMKNADSFAVPPGCWVAIGGMFFNNYRAKKHTRHYNFPSYTAVSVVEIHCKKSNIRRW